MPGVENTGVVRNHGGQVVFGAGDMYTDSNSWAAGGMVKLRFKEARDRVDVGFGGFEFNYDFYGVGNEAGDRHVAKRLPYDAVGFEV